MSYGIQIINQNSFLQIDEYSSVLSVAGTGQVTINTSVSNQSYKRGTIPLSGLARLNNSLLLVKPTSTPTSYAKTVWRGGMPNSGTGSSMFIYSNATITLDYILLTATKNEVTSPAGTGYGIEVYDSNNNVTFSSNQAIGKIMHAQKVNPMSAGSVTLWSNANWDTSQYVSINATGWAYRTGLVSPKGFYGPAVEFSYTSSLYRIKIVRQIQLTQTLAPADIIDISNSSRIHVIAKAGV